MSILFSRNAKYGGASRGGAGGGKLSVLQELSGFTSSFMTPELHAKTTEMFIAAARSNNAGDDGANGNFVSDPTAFFDPWHSFFLPFK